MRSSRLPWLAPASLRPRARAHSTKTGSFNRASACCGETERSRRVQAAVDGRPVRRRHALEREDRAEPQTAHDRQVQPADVLGQVCQRVRALVARILGRVGQSPDPAGIEHDNEGAAAHGRILAQALVARGCALK
jgi:hypothetical protein